MARWETSTRWYEAHVIQDLLGDWTVLRYWGGKESHSSHQRIDLVDNPIEGIGLIEAIDRRRLKRHYARVA